MAWCRLLCFTVCIICYLKPLVARLTVAKAVVYSNEFLSRGQFSPLEPALMGVLTFEQDLETNSPVRISGKLRGLTPGKHGFHIHELGNLEDGCNGASGTVKIRT